MERRQVGTNGEWEERYGYSRAVRVGDRVWVSGTVGQHDDGSVPGDVVAQTRTALHRVERALAAVETALGDVVALRIYMTELADADAVGGALRERFSPARPAMTMVVVRSLLTPELHVEIEVEAVVGSAAALPPGG